MFEIIYKSIYTSFGDNLQFQEIEIYVYFGWDN